LENWLPLLGKNLRLSITNAIGLNSKHLCIWGCYMSLSSRLWYHAVW
jgi:hypothetical protein